MLIKKSADKFSEEGTYTRISGYASIFNIEDAHQDIIMPGAFSFQNKTKLLWQHDAKQPIGICEYIAEDEYGLFIRAKLSTALEKSKEAIALIKEEIIDSFSIGFFIKEFHYDENSACRFITKAELVEVSLVTFPANPLANITHIELN